MLFGLVAYVVYRRFVERTSLTKRVFVPEEALRKDVREAEYGDILVPVFGTELDDDIVSTAGRLADAADRPDEPNPKLRVVYVMDLPLTVPLDAPPPKERMEAAQAALRRAREVGEEYETVQVETQLLPARLRGASPRSFPRGSPSSGRRRPTRPRRSTSSAGPSRRGGDCWRSSSTTRSSRDTARS